jgi:hypothetical protein
MQVMVLFTDSVDGRWLVGAALVVGLGAYALELGTVPASTETLAGLAGASALVLAGAVDAVRRSVCYRCVLGAAVGGVGLYGATLSSTALTAWLVAFVGLVVVVRALGDGVERRLQGA